MATLRDAERTTRRLAELAGELRSEAGGLDGDFGRMVDLADEVGRLADDFAATLARVDEILVARLGQPLRGESEGASQGPPEADLLEALSPHRAGRSGESDEGMEGLTKDELYARARAAAISGRSKMSRSELVRALRSHREST
jgi:hypothetical protein